MTTIFRKDFLVLACAGASLLLGPELFAQNSIKLFGPVDVRHSQADAGYGPSQVIFNTNTLNLSCPEQPSAVLSSTASADPFGSSGNILVDNFVSVTNLTIARGPNNVCERGSEWETDSSASCFNSKYQKAASANTLNGVDPDTIAAKGGVHPIDISSQLIAGAQQIKIDLIDEGGYVASSTIYLNTNCTSSGVNGPALITGNPISSTNPTPAQLDQNFTFNPITDQLIGFEYDLTGAQNAGSLHINPGGVIPQVADSGLEPLIAYPALVSGTSFATSMCLVHNGEKLNVQAACKLYTLECKTGTGSNASGAQCPVSTLSNEILKDTFDGPAFTLQDIATPNGPTFHEGLGLLMASEVWAGGPCIFDIASGLQNTLCPQNILIDFSGPGTFADIGRTTHPNSSFITIAKVPEDLTSVEVTDKLGNPKPLGPGNWTNNPDPFVVLTSQPPVLTGTALPGAATFLAAPIHSITYGISPGVVPPAPTTTTATDTVLVNPQPCPLAASPGTPLARTFTAPVQSLSNLSDGNYLLHYYAQDCAGTQELKFLQDTSGSWSTNFYTFPLNVDTVAPVVASGPTPSVAGPYTQGQVVTVTYSCTDGLSGVIGCGSHTFGVGTPATGTLTATLPTSAVGPQVFTVVATDAAGNTSSQSLQYQVNASTQVQFAVKSNSVVFPIPLVFRVTVTPTGIAQPTGTITVLDEATVVGSYKLSAQDKGSLIGLVLPPLGVGRHLLQAVYSDGNYAGGQSAVVPVTVDPGPVQLHVLCGNTELQLGQSLSCTVLADEAILPVTGTIGYTITGNVSGTATLTKFGTAGIQYRPLTKGSYTLSVTYAAQGNYQAATPASVTFTVN